MYAFPFSYTHSAYYIRGTQDRDPFGASFCLTSAKYLRILRDPFLKNPSFFDFSFLLLLEAREFKNATLVSLWFTLLTTRVAGDMRMVHTFAFLIDCPWSSKFTEIAFCFMASFQATPPPPPPPHTHTPQQTNVGQLLRPTAGTFVTKTELCYCGPISVKVCAHDHVDTVGWDFRIRLSYAPTNMTYASSKLTWTGAGSNWWKVLGKGGGIRLTNCAFFHDRDMCSLVSVHSS